VVVLGHNKDDALENIFTNTAGKCKYENLQGMNELSLNDNILVWRPFLNICKSHIVLICHEYNIPYLQNSTPVWSMRGQIRDKIVPCLNTWNPSFIDGLFCLSKTVSDLDSMLDDVVEMISMENSYNTVKFNLKKLHQSNSFWTKLFRKAGLQYISNKSMNHFLWRISRPIEVTSICIQKGATVNISFSDEIFHIQITFSSA
jgi:tRNA(Ile)-lysidine synthase TilS/MesJ